MTPRESALSTWAAGSRPGQGEGCPLRARSWLPLAQLGSLFPLPSVLPSLHPHGLAPIGVSPPSTASLQLFPGRGDPQPRARSAQHQAGGPPGWEAPRACRPTRRGWIPPVSCRCLEGRASSFSCTRRGRRNLTRVAVEMGPRPTLTASLRSPPPETHGGGGGSKPRGHWAAFLHPSPPAPTEASRPLPVPGPGCAETPQTGGTALSPPWSSRPVGEES